MLAAVLMTRRRTEDYDAVLSHLLSLLRAPRVLELVSDFEIALWKSVRNVLPGVKHFGCSFHWAQAIMKKVYN